VDLGFTEEQEMLRKASRDFLEKECPKSLVQDMEKDERGYPPELWEKMSNLGWTGLVLPEAYGGIGGSFLDLIILLEEMGRALLPGPFFSTVILGALPILTAGSEEQKQAFLPQVANGEQLLTLASTEPNVSSQAAGVTVRAVPDKDDYVIKGTKLFVPYAHVADWILCVARTGNGATLEDGITLFLIEGKSPGITVTVMDTMAGKKQCEVDFKDVRVPRDRILGQLDRGWGWMESVIEQTAVASCVEMVGGAQRVLEMTAEYAKMRVQFGRPIGAFQVTAHRSADQLIDVEAARTITYQAAWLISEGLPCAKEVSLAKVWVNEAYWRVCVEAHQTHGGIGVTEEFELGLYTWRAKAAQFAFGDSDFHREIIARQLGL
jgi:alkylation response protein AidB-like acyl-CoA dehydrogenase